MAEAGHEEADEEVVVEAAEAAAATAAQVATAAAQEEAAMGSRPLPSPTSPTHAPAVPAAPAPPAAPAAASHALRLAAAAAGCAHGCEVDHLHVPQLIALPCGDGGARIVLGRGIECSVQLDSLLHPQMVSREHCALSRAADGRWWLEELGSRNGTSINTQRLRRRQPRAALWPGDVVWLGCSEGACTSEVCYIFEESSG